MRKAYQSRSTRLTWFTSLMTYPKIELHVHLEGAVSAGRAARSAAAQRLRAARGEPGRARGVHALPGLRPLHRARGSRRRPRCRPSGTTASWSSTTPARAAAQGAVYLEAIFSPIDKLGQGIAFDTIFTGFSDGVAGHGARGQVGIEIRLTPDITRGGGPRRRRSGAPPRGGVSAIADRGIVGARPRRARGRAPAGAVRRGVRDRARRAASARCRTPARTAGPSRSAARSKPSRADRIRHGVRGVEDPDLLAELAERQLVLRRLRRCPTSGSASPLPSGNIPCRTARRRRAFTVNTDDPTFFSCDLGSERAAARSLGADPRAAFDAGMAGALCDAETKSHLRTVAAEFDWDVVELPTATAGNSTKPRHPDHLPLP